METSRLFARTAAKIDVEWIEDLAGDLLQIRHSEPTWSSKLASALCMERSILFGLEIRRSQINYSRIEPEEATDIFIRNGLIEGGIKERPKFFEHNLKLQEAAESELARRRSGSAVWVEDKLFAFYQKRIQAVGSFAELKGYAKKHHGGSLDFLKAEEDDLLPPDDSGRKKMVSLCAYLCRRSMSSAKALSTGRCLATLKKRSSASSVPSLSIFVSAYTRSKNVPVR
jgi:ATP-dependent helicase HrpA